jgi:hypothetical protein
MSNPTTDTSRDWLSSKHTNLLAWWIPLATILAGLLVPVSLRTAGWVVALGWMGAACLLNARRCNRTHCRYTGPYYLAMIVPVTALGAGLVTVGILGRVCLGVIILGGSALICGGLPSRLGESSRSVRKLFQMASPALPNVTEPGCFGS